MRFIVWASRKPRLRDAGIRIAEARRERSELTLSLYYTEVETKLSVELGTTHITYITYITSRGPLAASHNGQVESKD